MLSVEAWALASSAAALGFILIMAATRVFSAVMDARAGRTKRLLAAHVQSEEGGNAPTLHVRRGQRSAFDQLLLQQARLAAPGERSRLGALSQRTGRTSAYLRSLRSLWPSRRAAAAEALRWLGDAGVVSEMLTSMERKVWSTDVLVTAQAVAVHSTSGREIRRLLLYLLRYPNASPQLAAAVVNETTADVSEVVAEFATEGQETLCLTALELLRSRIDLVRELPLPWPALLRHPSTDVRCTSLHLYIAAHDALPAMEEADWDASRDSAVRVADIGEMWRLPAASAAESDDAGAQVMWDAPPQRADAIAPGRCRQAEAAGLNRLIRGSTLYPHDAGPHGRIRIPASGVDQSSLR